MTAEEAIISMLMGVGSHVEAAPTIPKNLQYYDYESSIYDYCYDGSSAIYGETRTIPKDSLVIMYHKEWRDDNNNTCYWNKYFIYQLIINDIDTESEEVTGIRDMQTGIEYMFTFNALGGR